MIAPKINGEFMQEVEHNRKWYCSFNTTLEITVKMTEDESSPIAWGYVEYKGAVLFRSDSIEEFYTPQDVVYAIVKYLHELRNVINYIK